jgi:hypothetical protein
MKTTSYCRYCLPFVLFLFFYSRTDLNAAVRTSTTSGYWATASTWSNGVVPGCGDSIIIAVGHTVTVNTQENYNVSGCARMAVVVRGWWYFDNGKKIDLPCGSKVYIESGGSISGDSGGSSNQITICGNVFWRQSDGTITGPQTLPVHLVSFGASNCQNGTVCFTWVTASENNNDHFELQKSTDGIEFKTVSHVRSHFENGTGNQMVTYSSTDDQGISGLFYFRLKQVDINGTESFSKVIYAVVPGGLDHPVAVKVFPNPSDGGLFIQSEGKQVSVALNVSISDSRGAVRFATEVPAGELSAYLETGLESGLYICTVSEGDVQSHFKIVIR